MQYKMYGLLIPCALLAIGIIVFTRKKYTSKQAAKREKELKEKEKEMEKEKQEFQGGDIIYGGATDGLQSYYYGETQFESF